MALLARAGGLRFRVRPYVDGFARTFAARGVLLGEERGVHGSVRWTASDAGLTDGLRKRKRRRKVRREDAEVMRAQGGSREGAYGFGRGASAEQESRRTAAAETIAKSYRAAPVSPETWLERREAWRTNAVGAPTEKVAVGFDTTPDQVLEVLRGEGNPEFERAVPLPTMVAALNTMWDEDGAA